MPHRLLHAGIISLGDLPRIFLEGAQVLIKGQTFNNRTCQHWPAILWPGYTGRGIGDQNAQAQNHRAYLARWRRPDDQQSGGRFPIRRLDRAVSLPCRVTSSKRDVRQDLRPDGWPPNLRLAGEFLAEGAEKLDGG